MPKTRKSEAWYKEMFRISSLRYSRTNRIAALARLGNKCNWPGCAWTDPRALQVDHIHGGGTKEKNLIGNHAVYRKILKMEQPELEYQLLCANHNQIKKVENNEVPCRPFLIVPNTK